MDIFSLSQVVKDGTHVSPNGHTSLIDLVLTSSLPQVLQCCTIPPLASSDHNGIHLTISWKSPRLHQSGPRKRAVWRYAHADFEKASEKIAETDWDALASDDIDQYCSLWQSTFLSIMEECIPRKVLPPRRRNLPWLNKPLVQSIRKRNCLFKRAKRSKLHHSQYKCARNRVTSQLRQAKKEYFCNLNTSDTKQFWKTVKVLNKKDTTIGALTHGSITCHSDEDKANAFNEFFSSCYNTSYPPISTLTSTGDSECSHNILCSEDKVCELLKCLDISKANGPDGISARMLRSTATAIAPSLTKLFNRSIVCGRPPATWKISSVVPIPKKSRPGSTADYRPISLLSILSKVLERHFHSLISDHLLSQHPLANCQWGFQPRKSTVSALLHTTHIWLQHLESGLEVGAIFFDFKKAFDRVPHLPLLSKLEKIGLDPHIIMWIHNYLAERHQRVVINGTASRSSHVLSGVPQGSILGPLLFLIYIDDITSVDLSLGSSLVLYADDILLFRPIHTIGDYSALQADINALSNWATQNAMTFNTDKCKCMKVSRKRTCAIPAPPLTLNGCILDEVPTFKYLGILISSDLSWSQHIQDVCSKARKITGLIYRRYYQYTDSSTLLQLYTSLVRPHVEYAAPVWDPHTLHDIQSLESVQKFALRACSKQWDWGYSELMDMFNLPSLENRRLYLKLCHLFKIVHGLCNFPSDVVVPKSNPSHISRSYTLHQPFARTSSFYSSFIPDSIRRWNYLPEDIVCAPTYARFKTSLRIFI